MYFQKWGYFNGEKKKQNEQTHYSPVYVKYLLLSLMFIDYS